MITYSQIMIKYIFLVCVISANIVAQVNTESLKNTNLSPGKHHSIAFHTTLNSGNSNYYSISNEYRFDYIPENKTKLRQFIVTKYNYSKSDTSIIKNNLFSHYRLIKKKNNKLSYEFFIQNESDTFKELKNRFLFGLSRRKNNIIFKTLRITVGIGLMNEYEKYSNQNSASHALRMTNNFIATKILNKTLHLYWINYYQPKLTNFSNYRILSILELKNKITKKIALSTILKYDYDGNTPSQYSSSNIKLIQKFKFKI
jgi:hypothetical protein